MTSIKGFKATTRQTEIQEAQHLDMGIGNKAYSPKFGEKVAHSIHNVKKQANMGVDYGLVRIIASKTSLDTHI